MPESWCRRLDLGLPLTLLGVPRWHLTSDSSGKMLWGSPDADPHALSATTEARCPLAQECLCVWSDNSVFQEQGQACDLTVGLQYHTLSKETRYLS